MSEARAITNLIGNGVAAVAVSRWEGELDVDRARALLDGKESPDALEAADAEPVAVALEA
jgi:Na+/H+-dicarboxylate symporter